MIGVISLLRIVVKGVYFGPDMEIIEPSVFTRQIKGLVTDDEYSELQLALIRRPEFGTPIPGGGGLRKLRWSASMRGRRRALWVIYYPHPRDEQIYMFLAYAQAVPDYLTREQLGILRKVVAEELASG